MTTLLALLYEDFCEETDLAEKKGRGKIAATVEAIIREPVEQAGYLLWDVDYYKEGGDYNLLVTIEHTDRSKGIDLDDCEKISRLLSPILDREDPIEGAYYLEVSSAGLERELSRAEHILFYVGEKIALRLFAPVNGNKNFVGTLLSYENETFRLRTDEGEELEFSQEAVAKATTVYENF